MNVLHGYIINEFSFDVQYQPPVYDLGRVTVPIALFWGLNDRITPAPDVALTAKALPNVVLNYKISNVLWHHLDFIWAIESERYLNTKVVEFLISG